MSLERVYINCVYQCQTKKHFRYKISDKNGVKCFLEAAEKSNKKI